MPEQGSPPDRRGRRDLRDPAEREEAAEAGGGLHSRVLAELGPAIASGAHPPGTVLRIDELEIRYGVSRTVVREAGRVLAAMHLVAWRRRAGGTARRAEEGDGA